MRSAKRKHGAAALAPIVTVALLCGYMFTGGVEAISTEQTELYHAHVKKYVNEIPYRIGSWVGTDVEAPPAAVRLLKPNALLQRRFVDPMSGRSFSLLVVHCGDVRDMQGHWPPICYPAHGWEITGSRETSLEISDVRVPAHEYDFVRYVDGFEQRMNVIGFFIVPEGDAEIVSSYQALTAAGRQRSRAGLGAAQVQFVSGGDMSASDRKRFAQEFVQAIEPMVRVIAEGVRGG